MANAVFDSTEEGVQATFVSSFTGDIVIRPQTKGQMSLFGDETPVTGSLTKLEQVIPYNDIINLLNENKEIKQTHISQVTGVASLDVSGKRKTMYLFGLNPQDYFSIMTSIHLLEGRYFTEGQKEVMIPKNLAEDFNLSIGDTVQFTIADGPYFKIRKASISGIYDYDIHNAMFDRFLLCDPVIVRDLMDIVDSSIISDEEIDEDISFLLDDELDFDSLFESSSDQLAESSDMELISDEEIFSQSEQDDNSQVQNSESSSWNYIICKLNNSINSKAIIAQLNIQFRSLGWPVQATDWRHAAGSTALYLNWLRLLLNIGIAIILVAGFIIVNNTLVINVLDRSREIGTLRAIGAKKRFISLQCMIETFMMTISGGILGTLLGILMTKIITAMNIKLTNQFLMQLFGTESIDIYVTSGNVLKLFILVVLLGLIGWIYPVITSLRVDPVKAMQGAK
ncbi:MAG: FtsX-like permease family protein [Treponema sp.]|nr:FtsX-like permease family protein [Treponema sp.]